MEMNNQTAWWAVGKIKAGSANCSLGAVPGFVTEAGDDFNQVARLDRLRQVSLIACCQGSLAVLRSSISS